MTGSGSDQDLNPGFPPHAGRTSLAKGRTGLAFFRTGIALITIAVTFTRFFGTGASIIVLDILLSVAGAAIMADGLRWYLPVRRDASLNLGIDSSHREPGVTVLGVITVL